MVLVRDIQVDGRIPREAAEKLCLMLSPLAPHLAEELWQQLGHEKTLAYEKWPEADESLIGEEEITIVIQVNGKKRDELRVGAGTSAEELERLALDSERVQAVLAGQPAKKIIVVPGRLVNVVH
jgi:leucyl-tRNA synthetase